MECFRCRSRLSGEQRGSCGLSTPGPRLSIGSVSEPEAIESRGGTLLGRWKRRTQVPELLAALATNGQCFRQPRPGKPRPKWEGQAGWLSRSTAALWKSCMIHPLAERTVLITSSPFPSSYFKTSVLASPSKRNNLLVAQVSALRGPGYWWKGGHLWFSKLFSLSQP